MAVMTAGARLEERWRSILSVHARTMCEIDRALHLHGLGASDFEVLDILAAEGPEEGAQCRVQNLVGRVHLSQSALSRLIARLEKDGLVERSMCAEDRRGVWVALTRRGRDLHAEVLPLQRAVLARMLGDDQPWSGAGQEGAHAVGGEGEPVLRAGVDGQ
ncbi:MarR family winged helix-turn-helix transcriptional regulator [Streptomyces sp. AC627_RSS907]|uniref:MarR family winged helix-turn-helix transcriptional regulator n=1 Tax=Streptomyces sp. AC627_RSS907 TaxID=2823684 RepID=UPI001C236A1F|nr:MarR family transcriptional regulator [Streptomyces sp. AC627_RSS907]